ncbi:MAG TPA: hypothetical protein VJQ82_06820, partial [Terriglobales bacterium]|nr:hypothetical protein [Terriglobales bacterium]
MRKSTRKPRNATSLLLVLLFAAPVFAQSDARIPPEVLHKSGYVNAVPKPPDFHSAMLWGIAIADRRVAGFEKAQIEIAGVQLSCRVDGKERVLNDDRGKLRGGLYRRYPWFQTDVHEPMPETQKDLSKPVMLKVGNHPDRVWHFWAGSPRKAIPPGRL